MVRIFERMVMVNNYDNGYIDFCRILGIFYKIIKMEKVLIKIEEENYRSLFSIMKSNDFDSFDETLKMIIDFYNLEKEIKKL